MDNRLPAYFQLNRYNIAPQDVVKTVLHCDPTSIQKKVIVTPVWDVNVFAGHLESMSEISKGVVYQLKYHGQLISFIRSGIGAPMTGDVILSLACTPCERVIFTGSIGGLDASMKVGDLLIPKKSLSGDGFSRYLSPDIETKDCFLQPAEPDSELQMAVMKNASKICKKDSVSLHSGTVFSIDSVIAQFFRLEHLVKKFGCIGIEMETSSVFKAAKLVDIRASALLQVSDVIPVNKSLFSGRSKRENEQRHLIRRRVLAKAVLDSIIDDIT